MANDWSEQMANEFVALVKDPATAASAAGTISARLRTLVSGALDKAKSDHVTAAKEEADKLVAAEKARNAEIDKAVVGDAVGAKASSPAKPDVPAWAPNTAHAVGDKVALPNGSVLVASTAGTTGTSAPSPVSVTDGTVVWNA